MGAGRPGSVITAGALALALGGGVQTLATAPAFARDCTASGLLSKVTNTVCTVTGTVTSTVDSATGGGAAPVTSTVGSAVGGVADTTGNLGSTPSSTPSGTPTSVTGTVTDTVTSAVTGVTKTVDDTVGGACLPAVASSGCDRGDAAQPGDGKQRRDPRKTTGAQPSELPTEPPRPRQEQPPQMRPFQLDQDPVKPAYRVDVDQAGLPLLIPGQYVPGLAELRAQPVRPQQAYDTLGTTLTAVLLLSAVLATRVVAARRQRDGMDELDSLPLSGLSISRGRHRVAVKL